MRLLLHNNLFLNSNSAPSEQRPYAASLPPTTCTLTITSLYISFYTMAEGSNYDYLFKVGLAATL